MTPRDLRAAALALCAIAAGLGCSFVARSPERYRDDTSALLGARSAALTSCYDAALATDPGARGQVTVKFQIEEETGKLVAPAVVPAQTTAPSPLTECVLRSLDGAVLAPPDARDGEATFTWDFSRPGAPSSG